MRASALRRIGTGVVIGALAATTIVEAQSQSLMTGLTSSAQQRLAIVEAAAAMMPEADYGFRPSPAARSFGEIVAHVADANRAFCSALAGARQPMAPDAETTAHTKAAILEHLKTANATCRAALAGLTDAALPVPRAFGGGALVDGTTIAVRDVPAGQLVLFLATHTDREYGKLTIYLRSKGLIPPTSQTQSRE